MTNLVTIVHLTAIATAVVLMMASFAGFLRTQTQRLGESSEPVGQNHYDPQSRRSSDPNHGRRIINPSARVPDRCL
ncbi:hypothetical protein K227x_04550 [Rubripirellula lacrimiformis]|uniref:Uncharacterized protein n=1 Tax=Rubripirellula lacrimiformis TaxID=1930273 RepID=A0A517N4M6_9BACT|nr:hypothetical protein [Rubripirellula lacrimiformis]QDT02084.1 hypothetical protein K227x_04550 [Rubripirellula lacrimiformis]